MLALAWSLAAPPAQAQRYTFTVLQDTTGRFELFSGPTIGDDGRVAFNATLRAGGSGIYRFEGATLPLTTIFESPLLSLNSPLGIDAGGRVIFELESQVVSGDGGPALSLFADASLPVQFGDDPVAVPCGSLFPAGGATNSPGLLPITCTPPLGVGLYLAGGGGSAARVCDSSVDVTGVAIFPFCGFGDAELSTNGTLAAIVTAQRDQAWLNAIATGGPGALNIVVDDGAGALGNGTLGGVPLERFEGVAVNDTAALVFGALVRDNPARVNRSLYTAGPAGLQRITPFVDPLDPSSRGLLDPVAPALNNAGTFVFEAGNKIDAATTIRGIYTGPDPELDKVVAVGDVLPGFGSLSAVSLGGMNNAGAIVFVGSSGALQAVIRADPVRPPSATLTLAPATASTPTGGSHTVEAEVRSGGALTDALVTFVVLSGPNAGQTSGPRPTSGGRASFTYTSNGTPGSDVIQAGSNVSTVSVFATAEAIWLPPHVTIDLTPSAVVRPAGSTHTVAATVTANGAPQAGVLVDFALTGTNAGAGGTCDPCVTDGAGQVQFTYGSNGTPGSDDVVASGTFQTVAFSASSRVQWSAPEVCSVLGDARKPWSLDLDVFSFTGRRGDHVSVRLAPDPAGTHVGDRATLILLDTIRGTTLVRADGGVLPNTVQARLPADGEYLVIVAAQPRWFRGRRFEGGYCVSVESPASSPPTLQPSAWVER